jgi:hypothetical protein
MPPSQSQSGSQPISGFEATKSWLIELNGLPKVLRHEEQLKEIYR